jgi:hypothetical protein
MKMKLIKSSLFAAVAATLAFAPVAGRAADTTTNTPAATETAPKKHASLPFKGTVATVDASAMTITVGAMTIGVTSTTKITKDGTPAVFADIAVGATVSGSYKKDAAGKLTANSVKIKTPKKKETAQ